MATKKQSPKTQPETKPEVQPETQPDTQSETETEYEKDIMVEIGALWMNESKKGDIYFTGYLNSARMLVLRNQFKKKDTDPDFVINIMPYKKPNTTSDSKQDKLKKMNQKKDDFSNPDDKDEIPF